MKPKLNRFVYLIGAYSITKEQAAYVGESSFIISNYLRYKESFIEYDYDDYGITWETTLKAAKAHFKGQKIKQLESDYWEVK